MNKPLVQIIVLLRNRQAANELINLAKSVQEIYEPISATCNQCSFAM